MVGDEEHCTQYMHNSYMNLNLHLVLNYDGQITVGAVIPGLIKDTARPSYWVPDHEVTHCCCCEVQFGPRVTLHHCRDCGQGVCKDCSMNKRAVPLKGWDSPVRVCDKCMKQD